MKRLLGAILISLSFVVGAFAQAEGLYVTGSGISSTKFTLAGATTSITTNSVGTGVGVGFRFAPSISVEGTFDYLGSDNYYAAELSAYSLGAWLVADPTIANIGQSTLKAVARVGVTTNTIDFSAPGIEISETETGLGYGLGLAVGINKNLDIIADWRHREFSFLGTTVDAETLNIGAKYTF